MPSGKSNLLVAAEWLWSNRGKNLWWDPNALTEVNKDPTAPHLTIVEARSIFAILAKRELVFPTIDKGNQVYHLHEAKEKEWDAFIAELTAETLIKNAEPKLTRGEEAFFTFYADSPVIEELEAYFQNEGLQAKKQYVIRASEQPTKRDNEACGPKDGFIVVVSTLGFVGQLIFKFFCLQVNAQCSLSVHRGAKPTTIGDVAGLAGIEKFLLENEGEEFSIDLKSSPSNQDMKAPDKHPSSATAIDALDAEIPNHCDLFRQDVKRATLELFGKGLGRSSAANERITRVSINHLQKGADFIFETLKEHVDWNLASENTYQHLQETFSFYFDRFSNHVIETHNDWFVKHNSQPPIHALQVSREAERLVKANYPKIETLTRKSMNNKSTDGGKPGINIGILHGNVQVGDHNVQNIQSSIRVIEAAIDAASAPPEQKAEAKTLLQKVMTNPLLAAAIGGVVSGLTKAAVE